MPFVAWFTVVVAGLIITAAAIGLLRVLLHLKVVDSTLEQLTGGVQAVAEKTSTVPTVLPSVNANLAPVRDFADSI
ncbi:MAG: hypothetical protein F4Y27_05550 [Acidimicrobiaceae bacterium]|nr:hypothetical protein [Acidimicrobiaceae bacterium]MYA74120.1 hypothetical protein [Acidimicrobiaceae bacterium]MYD07678.1 hypothetical protein [Acidimicrobiaceae bacterium]MYG55282.1 hypothetical protein [Acidimicrobiaceae bacterium]MYI59723.1 hypothetical protein [Acidimicrobiaceae bacterium]